MITAEQNLMQACRDAGFTDNYSKMIFRINPDSSNAYVEAIKKYAKEAIKADRLNLLNHVKTYSDYYDMDENPKEFKKFRDGADATIVDKYGDIYAIEMFYVDKDSLLNAPNIELL